MNAHLLDGLTLPIMFLTAMVLQILFIELGFRYGRLRQGKPKPHRGQMAQVRAIMGASLGLLAFMLAFSFSMAQQHHEERAIAYMQEVSAVDTAYRASDLILHEQRRNAKQLLRQFIDQRLASARALKRGDLTDTLQRVRQSEQLHDALWRIAEQSMEGEGDHEDTGLFAGAVLAMISAHDARLQAAFYNRISPVIWLSLLLLALLSMIVMGYQAGLTGTRSKLATWSIALTFSLVLVLIIDLDRPNSTLFEMSQDLMTALAQRMEASNG